MKQEEPGNDHLIPIKNWVLLAWFFTLNMMVIADFLYYKAPAKFEVSFNPQGIFSFLGLTLMLAAIVFLPLSSTLQRAFLWSGRYERTMTPTLVLLLVILGAIYIKVTKVVYLKHMTP